MTMTAATSETTKRCTAAKVQAGSTFSRHSFGTVVKQNYDGTFTVRNAAGFEWNIGQNILEQEFSFADQFEKEETVTRTRAIEILTENPNTAMTVCFYKKVDPKIAAEALAAGKGTLTDREWNKLVKSTLDGEERVMVGHHEGKWDEHRRLRFTEMAKGARLVDPRTLDYIIVQRTKFVVKE